MSGLDEVTSDDLWITALTVYGEARGSTQQDCLAVAHVIRNRAEAKRWWGMNVNGYRNHSPAAVCRKEWQFSCWNEGDPNRPKLDQLNSDGVSAFNDTTFSACMKAAIDALHGFEPDPTNGATHYVTTELLDTVRAPSWAKNTPVEMRIGAHAFFHDVE